MHSLVFFASFLLHHWLITSMPHTWHNWLRPFLSAKHCFLLCWICFAAAFGPFLSPLCSNTIRSFTFLFFVILSACWHLCCRICQVYLIYGFPSLRFCSFPSLPSQMCDKVLCSDAVQLRLSGDFHPLGGFNSSASHLHSSDVPISFTACFSCPWCLDGCRILFTAAVLISPVWPCWVNLLVPDPEHLSGFGRMPTLVWQWPFKNQWPAKDGTAAIEHKIKKCFNPSVERYYYFKEWNLLNFCTVKDNKAFF